MGHVRYPQGLGQKPYFLHRKMETHTILQISLYSTYSNQSEWQDLNVVSSFKALVEIPTKNQVLHCFTMPFVPSLWLNF